LEDLRRGLAEQPLGLAVDLLHPGAGVQQADGVLGLLQQPLVAVLGRAHLPLQPAGVLVHLPLRRGQLRLPGAQLPVGPDHVLESADEQV
jgi:hypothetical protein